MVFDNDQVLSVLEELESCKQKLRAKEQELNELISITTSIKSIKVKEEKKELVKKLDPEGKVMTDEENRPITEIKVTPAVIKPPKNEQTMSEFTDAERQKILELVLSKKDTICNQINTLS